MLLLIGYLLGDRMDYKKCDQCGKKEVMYCESCTDAFVTDAMDYWFEDNSDTLLYLTERIQKLKENQVHNEFNFELAEEAERVKRCLISLDR